MAKKQTKQYGWIYDKSGNLKQVLAPIVLKIEDTGTVGQFPLPKHKTLTGKLHNSAGFSM